MSGKGVRLGCSWGSRASGLLGGSGALGRNSMELERRAEGKGSGWTHALQTWRAVPSPHRLHLSLFPASPSVTSPSVT